MFMMRADYAAAMKWGQPDEPLRWVTLTRLQRLVPLKDTFHMDTQ